MNNLEGAFKYNLGQYLQVMQNLGQLYFDRLNSGEMIVCIGDARRRVTLCRKGTADYLVLKAGRTIFLECKSGTGQQTPDQELFEKLVTDQGAEYHLVRDLEEVERIIEGG